MPGEVSRNQPSPAVQQPRNVNAPATSGLGAKLSVFKGKVSSAFKSLRPGGAKATPKPLAQRSVQADTGALQAPMKQLRVLAQNQDKAEQRKIEDAKNQEIKKTVETNTELEAMRFQYRVNKYAPNHVKETSVKDGLQNAQGEFIVGSVWDQDSLKPAPLPAPTQQAKVLPEPQLNQILPHWAKMDPKETAEITALTKKLADNLDRLRTLDKRAEDRPADPQAIKLGAPGSGKSAIKEEKGALERENSEIGKKLGTKIADAYRQLPQKDQDAFALGSGGEFKERFWAFLRLAEPKLPKFEYKGKASDYEGSDAFDKSREKDILDTITRSAKSQLSNRVDQGSTKVQLELEGVKYETPRDILFQGAKYTYERALGAGGGGIAFLYKNEQGDGIVMKKQRQFESPFDPETMDAFKELNTHLALMGENGEGHENLLKLKGVVVHPDGYPLAILELAKGGDVQGLVGRPAEFGKPPSTDPEDLGTLGVAEKQGLISPHAANLVKLAVLKESIKGMVHLQEELGARHADIKPSNIFLSGDGKVKLADFGTTRLELQNQQERGEPGTLSYQPPEVLLNAKKEGGGIINAKADTWAIGVMAHEIFLKKLPIDGKDKWAMIRNMTAYGERGASDEGRAYLTKLGEDYDKTAMVQGVSSLDRLLNAMMHPDPEKRPALSEVLNSSLFNDLGQGENDLTPKVQELIAALQTKPQDPVLIKQKSDALGS